MVVMAFADGSLGESEVNLMVDRCGQLGLNPGDLDEALKHALADSASLDLPIEPSEQKSLMIDLIRMMAADGVLEESEKRLFALAAAKMSMTATDVDDLISEVLENS
ncbi:MAG: TerB family tellurite resistance protein [Planctomycetota bacterium]